MNEWNELLKAELLPPSGSYRAEVDVPGSMKCGLLRPTVAASFAQPLDDSGLYHRHPQKSIANPPVLEDATEKHGSSSELTPSGWREKVVAYDDAPEHLRFNPFIRTGYRTYLSARLCLESMFWWTNETVNIWSHILGLCVFLILAYYDTAMLQIQASTVDKVIVGMLLLSFQLCMIFSSIYHTFSCHSADSYDRLLAFDLFGIALSLLAIFMSGIYYAFWCNQPLRDFYMITIGVIFAAAMALQIPQLNVHSNMKMLAFVAWAAYGVVPTLHWYFVMGGTESTMVKIFIPRVAVMYALSGFAFLIYVAKIPERWCIGWFDCIGHSHNLWHLIVLAALCYWHNSGLDFANFLIENGCVNDRAKCYALTVTDGH
ncbi:progestin and adipoQ receptor family member 3 [Anopheles maculipalpis]|uniref:progestin and adipoQ receptor family member 3 n=1 Tax=Anopheles maculipalpis TaxID=1496333 RepID=UPI002158A3D4|nr:progestin and adipoQ receptor family member 3 [Anopheles maculipalpis]